MSSRHVLAGLALLATAAIPAASQARPDSAARDSVRAIEALRVRAAYTPRVVGSAAAVTVVPESLPGAVVAPSLGETLRRLPFVYIRQNSRGENEISVRGSESRQAAVLFEGVPLSLTWDARADLSAIPLSGVQAVDYVRGLSSLLAGPNAIGGVVTARLWEQHDPTRAPIRSTRANLEIDQYGAARTSVLAGGALRHSAKSSLQARIGAGWRDTPGIARPGSITEPGTTDALRLNTDNRSLDAFAGMRYEHAQGRYLSGFVSVMDGARGVAPELHIASPRLWRNPEVSRRIGAISAGTGAIQSRLGTGDAELSLGLTEGRIAINSYGDNSYASVTGTERGEDRTLSLRGTFDQQLGQHLVLRGSVTDAHIRYLETVNANPTNRYRQRLTSLATELDVRPTQRLTVTAGLSHDAANTDEAGGRTPLGRKTGLGWRGGATWQLPMQGLRLHASLSERKRFPALRELYSGALNRFVPNPALRPETARSGELGASIVRGLADLQLVAFTQRIDDAVVRVTLPSNQFQRVNRDRFTSTGVELTAGTMFWGASLRGDLTLQRARIVDATITDPTLRRPEDVPERFGSLFLTAPMFAGLEAEARARFIGATQCSNPASPSLTKQARSEALDLGMTKRWDASRAWRAIRATLQMDNVFDRAIYDKCGLPQMGRTLRLGLSIG